MRLITNLRRCGKSQRGSAFIVVLLLVLILSVLGLSMMGLASSNMQMADVDRDYQSVFYIAESGQEHEVLGLSDVVDQKCDDSTTAEEFFTAMDDYFKNTYTGENYSKEVQVFDKQFGETVTATVRIEGIGEWPAGAKKHTYTMISEGNIGGVRRKVATDIELEWTDLVVTPSPTPTPTPTPSSEPSPSGSPDASPTPTPTPNPTPPPPVEDPPDTVVPNVNVALFTIGSITMTGSAGINGPVGTNVSQSGGVSFAWSTNISGDMYISPNANPDTVFSYPHSDSLDGHFGNLLVMQQEPQYPLPGYPATPDLPQRDDEVLAWNHKDITIDQDGHYNLIKTNSYTLNIDIGEGVRTLVVDNFTVNGSGRVNIIGNGLLKLYVTNTFNLSGSSTFNAGGDADNVIMYYGGANTFRVDGATQFVGSVYVRSADVEIVGSGGVTGHMITGGSSVNITGNASAHVRVIYAPNAQVSLSGSGHVRGAVVANSCVMSGGTWITYDENAHLGDISGVIGGGNEPGGGEPGTGGPTGGNSGGGDPGGGDTGGSTGGTGGTGGGTGGTGGVVVGGEVSIDIGKLTELEY